MASLADIPEHLHHASQKQQFIHWLCLQPIPDNVRRALVSAWSVETQTPLTLTDWQLIKATATKIH